MTSPPPQRGDHSRGLKPDLSGGKSSAGAADFVGQMTRRGGGGSTTCHA